MTALHVMRPPQASEAVGVGIVRGQIMATNPQFFNSETRHSIQDNMLETEQTLYVTEIGYTRHITNNRTQYKCKSIQSTTIFSRN